MQLFFFLSLIVITHFSPFFFFNETATPEISPLSLHDALPISENHSRRTQFMARLVALADEFGLTIDLAYYPPYHSKYNPIERVWGVLEQHWNGSLLDSPQTQSQEHTPKLQSPNHPLSLFSFDK